MTLVSDGQRRPEPTVVFYGGTFDPPHVGHLRLVERARDLFPNARIWISVAPAPAGAAQQHKVPGASHEQRLAMCRSTFASLILAGKAMITDVESQLPAPNFTVSTLRHLQETWPTETWALLIGQDQLEAFAKWREPREILSRADLIVVSRGDDLSLEASLSKLAQELGIKLEGAGPGRWRWEERDVKTCVHLLPGAVSEAASREVRNDPELFLKKDWLVPEVASYIQAHGLYKK